MSRQFYLDQAYSEIREQMFKRMNLDPGTAEVTRSLSERWAVGFNDRGHGHGDFSVVVASTTEAGTAEVVVKCPSQEVAEHIMELQNSALDEDPSDRERKESVAEYNAKSK